jgi:hypothetical protein
MQKDLLEEAVRRYPIGTKFKSEFSDNGTIREVKPYRNHTTCEWYWDTHAKGIRSANGLYNAMPNACSNPLIYEDGKWAEIVTSAEDTIPEKWYMLLDNLSDEEIELCNKWRRSVCTTRRAHTIEQHHILINCHEDGSYYYGHAHIKSLKGESWANGIKEITFEQFKKHILKQETKTVMTKQKLTVPITEVLRIHSIACSTWKERIADYLPRVDNDQEITFDQEEVDTMFEAATETQLPTLENIFGKQVKKELTLKDMADGRPLFRENPNEGLTAMIEPRIGKCSDLKDKAFWLNHTYNWELKKDNEGVLCLVPTPNQYSIK